MLRYWSRFRLGKEVPEECICRQEDVLILRRCQNGRIRLIDTLLSSMVLLLVMKMFECVCFGDDADYFDMARH
jgi:hypothetical protein